MVSMSTYSLVRLGGTLAGCVMLEKNRNIHYHDPHLTPITTYNLLGVREVEVT